MPLSERFFSGPGGPLTRPSALTLFPPVQSVAVALVAALFRLVFWRLASSSAFMHTPVVDASFFDMWAQSLADGRVFQAQAFFKPPLYAYLLSFFYRLGLDMEAVLALQLVVGVLTCVLVLGVARAMLSPGRAFAAALVTALLPILPFFEVQLLAEPWTLFLSLAALLPVLLIITGKIPTSLRPLLAAGFLLGLAALGRPNLLLALAVMGGCLWWWGRRTGRFGIGNLVPLVAAFLLAVSPATLHNLQYGDASLVSANLGVNLYTGQSDGADGVSAIPVGVVWDDIQLRTRLAGADTPGASSRFLTRETLGWMAANPGRTLELWGKKAVLIGNAYEGRNNINPLWLAQEDGVFLLARWWPATWLLLPFAIVGLVFAGRGEPAWWLLKWLVLAQAAAVLPFFVIARFRAPLLPLLALFGVAGAVLLLRALREKRWLPLAVLVVAAVYVNVDWFGLGDERWLARDHFNQGLIHTRAYGDRRPDAARAEHHFRRSLALDPDDVDTNERFGALLLGQAQPLVTDALRAAQGGGGPSAAGTMQRADALLRESRDLHRKATGVFPRSFRSWANLGTALMWQGDLAAARSGLALAATDSAAARQEALAALRHYEDASRSLQQSLVINRAQSDLRRQVQMVAGAVLELPNVAPEIGTMQERVRANTGQRR